MGYYLPEPAPAKPNLTAKNRVWGFFGESVSVCLETRPAALEPHQENYAGHRETVSGITLWPSRDPIGEEGGINLYAFVGNDGVNRWDILGQMPVSEPEYVENPPVFNLPIGGAIPVTKSLKLGQAIIDFGISIKNQSSRKCCIEAKIVYSQGPYAWVDNALASSKGYSLAVVAVHEFSHMSSLTKKVQSLANMLKQETECYDSEADADDAIRSLGAHYSFVGDSLKLSEAYHDQSGGFGTPRDGGID